MSIWPQSVQTKPHGFLRFGGAAVKGIEPPLARAVAPEAGFIERHDAVRRLDARVRVQPLRKEQFAAGRPAEGVDVLMIVARAETAQDDLAFVAFAVAVGVGQQQQLGAFAHVTSGRI
jgi:hypothetical protein